MAMIPSCGRSPPFSSNPGGWNGADSGGAAVSPAGPWLNRQAGHSPARTPEGSGAPHCGHFCSMFSFGSDSFIRSPTKQNPELVTKQPSRLNYWEPEALGVYDRAIRPWLPNRHLSEEYFKPIRGCRVLCPLSSLIILSDVVQQGANCASCSWMAERSRSSRSNALIGSLFKTSMSGCAWPRRWIELTDVRLDAALLLMIQADAWTSRLQHSQTLVYCVCCA